MEVGRSGGKIRWCEDGPERVERDVVFEDASNGDRVVDNCLPKENVGKEAPLLARELGEVRVTWVEAGLPKLFPCRLQGRRVVAVDRCPAPHVGESGLPHLLGARRPPVWATL